MTEISKRFESFIKSANKKLADQEIILPTKTEQGILIGNVLIKSVENLKDVYYNDIIYKDIYLNAAAIKIATLLALKRNIVITDEIYKLDQEYGKWFVDNQHLLALYKKAQEKKDYDRADMLWARYQESNDRAKTAKLKLERLIDQR